MYVENIGVVNAKGRFKEHNEDYHLVIKNTLFNSHTLYFACIADGMGGYDHANIASHFVIDSLEKWWKEYIKAHDNIETLIQNLDIEIVTVIKALNKDLIEKGKKENLKYGTTLSALVIIDHVYFIYHIGDGRIYRFDEKVNNYKGTVPLDEKLGMYQLTLDHTVKDLEAHPSANSGTLTQCLGVKGEVDVFNTFGTFNDETTFILCTDGVYKSFEKKELEQYFKNKNTAQKIVDNIYTEIKEREFSDDVCLIVINHLLK